MRVRRTGPVLTASGMLIAVLLAACSTPAGSPIPTDPPASPSQNAQSPTPSEPAAPTPVEPTAEPTDPSPPGDFTEAEQMLLKRIRPDARRDCAPRRTELPDGATGGVECQPAEGIAARVGMYQFATDQEAARAYFARMADEEVAPRSGDCGAGVEGDAAWTPGDEEGLVSGDAWDGVTVDGEDYIVFRYGCFLNDAGLPNYRATCGNGLYVGILGRTGTLGELFRWAWENAPDAPMNTPGAPGICYYP